MIGRVVRPLNLLTIDDTEPEIDLNKARENGDRNIEKSASYDKN